VALSVGELVGTLSLDDKDWDRGIKSAHSSLDRLGSEGAPKANRAGALIGGAISAGLLMAAAKIASFADGAVDSFAAVEDATGAAGVVFGSSLPTVLAFADKAGASFGLSKRAAIEAQNTFATLGKAAGLQGAPLAGFSGQLTGLAGDLASFKGTSTEQAVEAVGAALRGEMEPIRAYGVLLDDSTLRLQAVKMGLIKTVKEGLTPSQKALAAQAAILAQTKDAQGDYARTSTSTANVQKTLAAETENAQAALGQKLAPAVTWARTVMLGFIGSLSGAIDKTTALVGWAHQHEGALMTGAVAVGLIAAAVAAHNLVMAISSGRLQAWILQTGIVRGATATWAAIQWVLNAALTANPIGIVIGIIALLIGAVVLIATKTTFFQTAWKLMCDGVGAAWQWLFNTILAPVFRMVLDAIGSILGGIANMLGALGNIPGFGWAKDAAANMREASTSAHNLANGIKDIPDKKTIDITARFSSVVANATQTAAHNLGSKAQFAVGTDFAPGGRALVGERGPEIVNLPRGSQVIPNHMIGQGGNGENVVAAVKELGDRFGAELQRQARTIQTMQRQMA
jgi:hypothetical protein